jgi:polyhydroxyalkanoate synthase
MLNRHAQYNANTVHGSDPALEDKPRHPLARMVRHAIGRRFHRQHYLLHDRSPRQILLSDGLFSLKVFEPLGEKRVHIEGESLAVEAARDTPVLLVPPLGVYAWIFDLMAERSLVRYFLARGYRVYLVDWGQPSPRESHLTLEQYALKWLPQAVEQVCAHSGQAQVSLLGYCMGGLLSLIYTAAHSAQQADTLVQTRVRNLITIASPVNMHQMSGPAGKVYQMLSGPSGLMKRWTGHELSVFNARHFHVDGRVLSVLFRLTQPKATLSSYVDLLKHLSDKAYVSRYTTMNEWFSHMPDYPGATVREMIQRLGLANGMASGQFNIGGQVIDLRNITCPILAFAGANDAITSIGSATALMSVVGSTDLSFEVVPGGHAGLFTGSSAVQTTWAIAADWLALRSDASVPSQ